MIVISLNQSFLHQYLYLTLVLFEDACGDAPPPPKVGLGSLGCFGEGFGGLFGGFWSLGRPFGASWAALWGSWAALGASWSVWEPSSVTSGGLGRPRGPLRRPPGPSWCVLAASWAGVLVPKLGPRWAELAARGGQDGPKTGQDRAKIANMSVIFGFLGMKKR